MRERERERERVKEASTQPKGRELPPINNK